jgi:uncharacterized protein (DUF488 family)
MMKNSDWPYLSAECNLDQPIPRAWPPNIHPLKECGKTEVFKKHPIFTIGHSNKKTEEIISCLKKNDVEVLVDVRSVPYSQHVPQANREAMQLASKNVDIKYVFMGDQLGGRPADVEVNDNLGNYDYSELATTDRFREGLKRLLKGAEEYTVCILCSEEDPVKCHRGLLISRELAKRGIEVRHLRHDGTIETQEHFESRIPPVQLGLFSEK